jgi:hypothetical protein
MEDVVTSLSGTPALTSGQIRTSKNETFLANRTPVFQASKKSAWKLHETGHLFFKHQRRVPGSSMKQDTCLDV